MKTSYKKWIELLNSRLELYNQTIRVVNFTKQELTLSNTKILVGSEFTRFKKRVMNKKTDLWLKNIDNLFSGNITEKQIKSKLSSLGGKAVQKKHGADIKQNLNTGTPWNKGLTGLAGHSQCDEAKRKISIKNSGSRNGMFGVKMSAEDKEKKSVYMKQLILSGKFTPNSNNRNTHWNATYNEKKYRSSWEALYHYINPLAEYETFRIEYILNTLTKVYIVDFIDKTNKQVIEVKPRELCTGDTFNSKINALSSWANDNGYDLLVADKEWFQAQQINIDYNRFDENTARKIKALYEVSKTN